MDQRALVVVRC